MGRLKSSHILAKEGTRFMTSFFTSKYHTQNQKEREKIQWPHQSWGYQWLLQMVLL